MQGRQHGYRNPVVNYAGIFLRREMSFHYSVQTNECDFLRSVLIGVRIFHSYKGATFFFNCVIKLKEKRELT
jgi:hypothetical protein